MCAITPGSELVTFLTKLPDEGAGCSSAGKHIPCLPGAKINLKQLMFFFLLFVFSIKIQGLSEHGGVGLESHTEWLSHSTASANSA